MIGFVQMCWCITSHIATDKILFTCTKARNSLSLLECVKAVSGYSSINVAGIKGFRSDEGKGRSSLVINTKKDIVSYLVNKI